MLWLKSLPLGPLENAFVSIAAWLLYLIGLRKLFYSNRAFFIFVNTLFFVTMGVCYLTFGARVHWYNHEITSARYFSHLIIVLAAVVGIGISEILSLTKKWRYSSAISVVSIGLLATALAANAYQIPTERNHYRSKHTRYYEMAASQNLDGIILGSNNHRVVKLFSLLHTYRKNTNPFYSFLEGRLRREPNVEETNIQLRPSEEDADIVAGTYLSNVSCADIQSSLTERNSTYSSHRSLLLVAVSASKPPLYHCRLSRQIE